MKRAVLQGVHDMCMFEPRGAWPAGAPLESQIAREDLAMLHFEVETRIRNIFASSLVAYFDVDIQIHND